MLGNLNTLTNLTEEVRADLFVSFLLTEDGSPIAEEDGDNFIRENL